MKVIITDFESLRKWMALKIRKGFNTSVMKTKLRMVNTAFQTYIQGDCHVEVEVRLA